MIPVRLILRWARRKRTAICLFVFRACSSYSALLVCMVSVDCFGTDFWSVQREETIAANSKEAAIFDRILNRIRFENDGTEVSETEAVVKIQSQAGVEEFGQLVFGYSSATEKLDIEYVRVRKPDGQVVVTPDSTAQDFAPDVLKEAPMYSDYRQRHISVAALQPGDTLEYRTVTRVFKPLAGGKLLVPIHISEGSGGQRRSPGDRCTQGARGEAQDAVAASRIFRRLQTVAFIPGW